MAKLKVGSAAAGNGQERKAQHITIGGHATHSRISVNPANAKLGKNTARPFRHKIENGIGGELIPDVEEAEIRDKPWRLG